MPRPLNAPNSLVLRLLQQPTAIHLFLAKAASMATDESWSKGRGQEGRREGRRERTSEGQVLETFLAQTG